MRGRSRASSPRRKNFMVGRRGSRRVTQKNQLARKGTAGETVLSQKPKGIESVWSGDPKVRCYQRALKAEMRL